jgi:hypothetical protein
MLIENQMWLHGWLCSALAEFMVVWRWENMLLNEFLNGSLKMLLVMCCYQTSLLLLVTGTLCWNVGTAEKGKRCS